MFNYLTQLYQAVLSSRPLFERTLILIPLVPFAGFLINGLFGRRLGRRAAGDLAIAAALGSFIWAVLCVLCLKLPGAGSDTRNALHAQYWRWLSSGDFSVSFGLFLDHLSAVMILIVTGVGALIHIYSAGYMAHDASVARYFAYLNLFLAAMCLLVLGDNLLALFIGWEGVGLCSYLLIGFWYEDPAKAAAGMKAFVVNRIGDLGFTLGILALIAIFGTANLVAQPERVGGQRVTKQTYLKAARNEKSGGVVLLPKNPGLLDYGEALRLLSNDKPSGCCVMAGQRLPPELSNLDLSRTVSAKLWPGRALVVLLTFACVLLFIGAIGKSAQIPLYVWLPDAMAGPTPVSALIHAATMVTAGVYMVCRLHGLFAVSPDALRMVAVVGGATALFSALMALTQLDIKKVLAYSTVSQLGYMFLGLGVGGFSFAIFHVFTHAFFKALLFLGAGAVIHALAGEQDLRRMGGLRRKLPVTFWTMLIGALALAGLPPFAGWWSKDKILLAVLARFAERREWLYLGLYVCAAVGALCTAFYTFRLIFLAFLGESRASAEKVEQAHEAPLSMTVPLIVLAAFSLLAGMSWHEVFVPAGGQLSEIGTRNITAEAGARLHHLNLALTLALALAGVALAWLMYCRKRRVPDPAAASKGFLYRLSFNKFYVDEVYHALFVAPFELGAELAYLILDVLGIDLLVTGSGKAVAWLGGYLRRMQTGLVNTYAAAILVGALALLLYLLRG